jgi:hypothetical protein
MRCCGAGGKRCGATAGQLENKRNEMECNALFRLFSFFSRRAATCGSVRVPVHAVGVTAERGAGRHYFHAECLARWAERSTACPVCRCRVEVSVGTVLQHCVAPSVATSRLARCVERAGYPVGRCRVEPKLPACPWVRSLYCTRTVMSVSHYLSGFTGSGCSQYRSSCSIVGTLKIGLSVPLILGTALPVRLKRIISTLNSSYSIAGTLKTIYQYPEQARPSGACRAPLELP